MANLVSTQKAPVQNVEIYLDYATIPSLNYFLHFAENKEDMETIRLFGLGRFTIPESVINAYPKGIIQYIKVGPEKQSDFNYAFQRLLSEATETLNLNFHLNLFHSLMMFAPLLDFCFEYKDKIGEIRLNFYDDGAEGVSYLHNLAKSDLNIEEEVSFHQSILAKLFETREIKFSEVGILRYLWNECYPSHYTLIRSDYLNTERLLPLKNRLEGHYTEMDLNRYNALSREQWHLILNILNVPLNTIKNLVEISLEHKVFVFTGTTIFDGNRELLEQLHLKLLAQYIDPTHKRYIGEGYAVFYKGHPNSPEINKKVAESFNGIAVLPEEIPLEILFLLGLNIEKIGGFASTTYLSLKNEKIKIGDVAFLTEVEKRSESYLYETQYNLSKLMIELGCLKEEQVIYYPDI